jgi:hypothetical protein
VRQKQRPKLTQGTTWDRQRSSNGPWSLNFVGCAIATRLKQGSCALLTVSVQREESRCACLVLRTDATSVARVSHENIRGDFGNV